MPMKQMTLWLMLAFALTATAENKRIPMLEEGKQWIYAYYQVVDEEAGEYGYPYMVWYTVKGDTVIDSRNYKKVYRKSEQDYTMRFRAAMREDADGRVYAYNLYGDKQDGLILDFDMKEFDGRPVTVKEDKVKAVGSTLRRYRYSCTETDGTVRDLDLVAVEGVGFRGKGLMQSLDPVPPCICDYETLVMVQGGSVGYFGDEFFNTPADVELTADERQLVKQNNAFAFDLFRVARSDGDRIISPLSITMALALLNNAADGLTRDEITGVLGATQPSSVDGDFESPTPTALLNSFCRKLLTACGELDPSTKVTLANTIFASDRYRLCAPFVQAAKEWYDADVQTRDFTDVEGTVADINQWADDHTQGMIPQVISAREFDTLAVSYLLNAIYFKGAWTHKFNPEYTRDEVFQGAGIVPMMQMDYYNGAKFTYDENDLYQSVVLPYGNEAYRMTVYLPREGKTIDDVLSQMDGSQWRIQGQEYKVDLKMPRFETDTDLKLNDIMAYLGMPSAFDPYVSVIPWLCEGYNAYIEMMKQVARIKVSEEGTEAAAVTIIGEGTTGMPQMATFHANHPFFYIISERSTGAILFMGQFVGKKPTQTGLQGVQSPTVAPLHSSPITLYSVSGMRLQAPSAKGVYIVNGKKVVR